MTLRQKPLNTKVTKEHQGNAFHFFLTFVHFVHFVLKTFLQWVKDEFTIVYSKLLAIVVTAYSPSHPALRASPAPSPSARFAVPMGGEHLANSTSWTTKFACRVPFPLPLGEWLG